MKRTIAIYGKSRQDTHNDELRRFCLLLPKFADRIYMHPKIAASLEGIGIDIAFAKVTEMLPEDTDLVVSLGGDGTFLRAAAWTRNAGIPVMGINTGHLGYLAGYTFDDMEEVERGLGGDCDISARMTLKIISDRMPDWFFPYALNEVAVLKGDSTSMVSVRAYIDGMFLADYLADGLVVATPTGSTAYSLSAGGPILQPTLANMIISPVAPHSLTMRPLVISSEADVRLEVSSRGAECHVECDGRKFVVPSHGTVLEIRHGDAPLKVVQPRNVDFATLLRTKLLWGQGRD